MNNLLSILKGCLNSNTINQAESMLVTYSEQPTFVQQLLLLIPNQQPQILIMILSTLKNYMLSNWNPSKQKNIPPIPQNQKQLICENILNLFYEIKHNQQAVNLYKEIQYILVLANYPWPGVDQQLLDDLNTNIFASVHFFRQLAKAYQYSTDEQERRKSEYFVNNYFPKLQHLVEQCITNFNDQTSKLLFIIFKTFYSSFHIELPLYLKNQDNFSKWFIYFKAILNAQLLNNILNQRISAKIISRMISQYLNQQLDGKNLKGWSESLRARHGQEFTQLIFNCLSNPNGDQQTASYILDGVMSYSKNQKLRIYLNEKNVSFIIYDRLLPNMQTSVDDLELSFKDPLEYIRKDEDLNSNGFIRNAADAIEFLLSYCSFGDKSELMKFIEYSANNLTSNSVTDRHKQILIRQLTKMSNILKKNKFIKAQFQNLTITYFIPLLKIDSPLLNSEVCRLFAAYLDDMKLSADTVGQLMELIYEKMVGKSKVLKYNAILAFTSLLSHQSALKSASSHFQNILQIYVKMLDQFEHENLLKCLESIVNSFSHEIVTYAPNLINHLLSKFYENYNSQENEEENPGQDDGNKQSVAALSTVEQILQCPLSDEVYFNMSQQIIPMLKQIFDELQEYFGEILSLINVLIYKAKKFIDMQFVYVLCRVLLEGKNCSINKNSIPYQIQAILSKIKEETDSQYEENLISILKNLLQKMPDNILHKYSYPLHSELILALIENGRLTYDQILNLNTSMVDGIWSQYLQTYTFLATGKGAITNSQGLKAITGVSLYPWIEHCLDINIVKIVLSQIQSEEQEDEDFDDENTMQMLEKYANQDEQQECDEYYGTEGVNYCYLYNSQYDSSKDRDLFLEKLKMMSNQQANNLMNVLNNKDKKRLQALFN